MARPVDYRKGRGSKGVHTADERLPLGKKDQGRDGATPPDGQKTTVATSENATTERRGKHAAGHAGQKPH
jgi:hypothetical protein